MICFNFSNNNNNNNNDNKFNGNENDLNEGNAMSETMAMNMIMPGGRTFSAEPVMTIDDKTGNKLIHFRRKRMLSEEVASNANLADEGKVASVIMDFVNLWMKSIAANSKDCQRFHFCITNDQVGNGHALL